MGDRQPDDYWDFFAKECARMQAPLYARFAEGVGGDEELRRLAAGARPGQPHGNMLFAAVHYLLLRGAAAHRLRDHYPDLAGGRLTKGDPFPAFRDFCMTHRVALEALIATRVTNTNEVGRAAFLLPGFLALAAAAPEPLHLIEIGPSAGLNLVWDRYGYRYRNGETVHVSGARDAKVVIETPLRGTRLPPLGPPPKVGRRLGLERNPVNLARAAECDWLRALVWPDHRVRALRLDRALAAYAGAGVEIRAGDALELLPDALAALPEGGTVCVYHTCSVYQFSDEMKRALEDQLAVAGLRRPLWRLSLERAEDDHPLVLACYADGRRQERVLAIGDPQGAWMEWRA